MEKLISKKPAISRKILVIGSNGQIGTALIPALYEVYGKENVIASDKDPCNSKLKNFGKFYQFDVTVLKDLEEILVKEKSDTIINLAAILSAAGELNPIFCRNVNNKAFENCLDLAHKYKLTLFSPSTIAVFGDKCPKYDVPDDPILLPRSMYGVTKVYKELLGKYYNQKFGVDFRSIRYPGIMSSEEYEYHGTTDYSTEIFFEALRNKKYTCYLTGDTPLPLIHIDDAIRATLQLLDTENSKLTRRVYNLAGLSLTPNIFYNELKKIIPEFVLNFKPDHRQAIADSWPGSINDSSCKDWGFSFKMTPQELVEKMFKEVQKNEEKRIAEGRQPIPQVH